MAKIEIKIPDWLDRFFTYPLLKYRLLRYGDPFRKIYLGEGKFALVSPEHFYWLNNFHWCARKTGPRIYAVRFVAGSENKTGIIAMHRMICNPPKGVLVDHKNRNTLDNRPTNLRPATYSQNACNRSKTRRKTSSKYVGVSLRKNGNRFDAYIHYEGKKIHLGRFDNEIDAARRYDTAAKEQFGEFSRLNFPDTPTDTYKRDTVRFTADI